MTRGYPVKITIQKKISSEEVFGHEYFYPDGRQSTICPHFKEGYEYIVEHAYIDLPDDFPCSWAWQDLWKDLSVLSLGGDFTHTEPKIMYTTCRDGTKPVVFKLERIEGSNK
jgi:uncharacterized repeat protein (TIGR04076 family)